MYKDCDVHTITLTLDSAEKFHKITNVFIHKSGLLEKKIGLGQFFSEFSHCVPHSSNCLPETQQKAPLRLGQEFNEKYLLTIFK